MTPKNEAETLLRKAAEDEVIVRKHLADTEVSDSIWGFHAQQTAEKLLKAVLMRHQILFPRTHDLLFLAGLLSGAQHSLPVSLDELAFLNAFAVTLRYEDTEKSAALDRKAIQQLLTQLRTWAESQVTRK
jgi:HEPN domain-containing protein